MFFDRWIDLFHALVKATIAYVAMVCVLRSSGKRTLAKLNAFDLVVTVALGSVLATMALSSEVSLSEGFVVIGVLVAAQYLVTKASTKASTVQDAVRAEPVLVVDDGQLLHDAMTRARLTSSEVLQAVRMSGLGDIEAVAAVVLETDGSLSVISREQHRTGSAVSDVRGHQTPPPAGPQTHVGQRRRSRFRR